MSRTVIDDIADSILRNLAVDIWEAAMHVQRETGLMVDKPGIPARGIALGLQLAFNEPEFARALYEWQVAHYAKGKNVRAGVIRQRHAEESRAIAGDEAVHGTTEAQS